MLTKNIWMRITSIYKNYKKKTITKITKKNNYKNYKKIITKITLNFLPNLFHQNPIVFCTLADKTRLCYEFFKL